MTLIAVWSCAGSMLAREGWRGLSKRFKQTLRYWYFRSQVRRTRSSLPGASAPSGEPLFSILLVAYRTRPSWFEEAVESVRRQTCGEWELCIGLCEVPDAVSARARQLQALDARIRVFDLDQNGGISANNNAVARHARGEFIAVLDHDDYLEPTALAEVAALARTGAFDLIHTDEDVVSPVLGIPSLPLIKPDWSPETLLSFNYICHFCCFRRTLFERTGGFRSLYDGAQDYDLFLRITEQTSRIGHVPKVLYHWRRHGRSTASGPKAKPASPDAGRRAVADHLARVQANAVAEEGPFGLVRVRHALSSPPAVDIIIPSSNRDGTLERCLESLVTQTAYARFRATVMLNGDGDFGPVRAAFGGRDDVRFLDYDEPFNFSRINNLGVAAGEGEALVFLNDDVEITQPDWLDILLGHAMRPEIGAAGPMLLYPDRTVQHSGLLLDPEVIAIEFHLRYPETASGYNLRLKSIQNVSAVTGACICSRREVFLGVGGFNEAFPLAYNDIDYCLKLTAQGYRIVFDPYVRLLHHESLTRNLDTDSARAQRLRREQAAMREAWGTERLKEKYFDASILRASPAALRSLARQYGRAASGARGDS